MANFYYYSQDGAKIGVSGVEELKQRVKMGMIMPDTIIENEEGRQALAGKVKGLVFAESVQSNPLPQVLPTEEKIAYAPIPPVEVNPTPIDKNWYIYLGVLIILITVTGFVAIRIFSSPAEQLAEDDHPIMLPVEQDVATMPIVLPPTEQTEIERFLAERATLEEVIAVFDNGTLLHVVVKDGWDVSVAELLVSQGADVDAKDFWSKTPFHYAAEKGNIEVTKLFISHGTDVNVKTHENGTPLHFAANGGHIEVARFLVSAGADVNAEDESGWLPFHRAANDGHIEVGKYLVSISDKRLLNSMTRRGDQDKFARFFISVGGDVNAGDDRGLTFFQNAVLLGRFEILEFLVLHRADVNVKMNNGKTPLHSVAYRRDRHIEVAKFLVSHGADVNSRDNIGRTPLHEAVTKENIEVTRFLVSVGANVNARDMYGWTPLHDAADDNKGIEIVLFLASNEAAVNAKTNNGNTPLDLAKKKGNTAVVQFLSNIGAW